MIKDPALEEYVTLLEELKKRREHASQTYVPDDNPRRNQRAFHASSAWCRLLFGGNRSGKSRSAAQEIYWWTTNTHPHLEKLPNAARIWVLSAEYRTLYEGIWIHLRNVLPHWEIRKIGAKVPNHDIPSYVEMKSGARVDFISAQGGEETRRKLQAAEIDLLSIDEEISGDLWDELQMRLLTRGGRVIISATLIESEDWLLDLEDRAEAGDPDVNLVRLDTKFNKYNDEVALKRILSKLSSEEQQVRILGKRRKASGLIYANWRTENTDEVTSHLIEPFTIPSDWTRVMCLDPGWRTFAGLWVAISPNDLAVAYREMYLLFAELHEAVEFINLSEINEKIDLRLIDPASYKHFEDGSLGVGYQLAEDYNLDFSPALNDKRQNVEAVRKWLMPTPHLTKEGLKIPGFRIFKTLESFLSERRKYKIKPDTTRRDRDRAADRPLKKFDHLMNCWEYIATNRLDYIPAETDDEELDRLAMTDNDSEEMVCSKGQDPRMFKVLLYKRRKRMAIERGYD